MGATKAINDTLGLFTFEGNAFELSIGMLENLDAKGYSCFSTSKAGLFKWNGNCMHVKGKTLICVCIYV
jgi:hypothetical protein